MDPRARRPSDREPRFPGRCGTGDMFVGAAESALWFALTSARLAEACSRSRIQEIAHEVEAALNAHGPKAFGTECLRLIREPWSPPPSPAFYEEYGTKRVKEGLYDRVVRQDEHLVPLARTLEAWAGV